MSRVCLSLNLLAEHIWIWGIWIFVWVDCLRICSELICGGLLEAFQIVWTDPEIMGDLGHREPPKRLLPLGGKLLDPQLVELARDLGPLGEDLVVKLKTWEKCHLRFVPRTRK